MQIFDPRNYGANPNDNTDDTSAIQAALDAARDAGGGHVILSSGTYIITGSGKASDGALRIYDNTELSGNGMGETILKIADGWSQKITGMIRTPVNQETENVIIRDLTLDGNRDNVDADIDGIMTGVLPGKNEHDNNILIERVEIHDVSRIAFNPHEQTHNLTIRDSVAHHNSWDGFIADYVVNGLYENNVAYSNDRHGFNIVTHSNNMVVKDNVSYDNAGQGIVLQRGSGSTTIDGWEDMLNHDILVTHNEIYNNGKNGILLKQVQDNQIVENIIYGNGDDGIQIEGAFGNVIDGNTINSNIHGIEIRAYSGKKAGPDTSHDNIIINNDIVAVNDTIAENHDSTLNNVYAGNNVSEVSTDLGTSAIIVAKASLVSYDLLQINVQTPDHDNTPPPVEQPTETVPDESIFVSGNSTSETLHGKGGDDTIKGRAGDDTLYGGAGDDYIEGNAGDDIIHGGLGADVLKGSAGIDTFVFSKLEDAGDTIKDFKYNETLDLSEIVKDFDGFNADSAFKDGFIRLEQHGKNTQLYLNEKGNADGTDDILFLTMKNVTLSSLNIDNFVFGTPSEQVDEQPVDPTPAIDPIQVHSGNTDQTSEPLNLSGTSNNDILNGGSADDRLVGYKGDDVLIGNDGDDKLWGNDGDDLLYGGAGFNTMKGGDGRDTFVLDAQSSEADNIVDFRSQDYLDIQNILAFDPLHDTISDFIKITDSGKNSVLSVDLDGAKNGENFTEIAQLSGVTHLDSAQSLYDDGTLLINNTNFT